MSGTPGRYRAHHVGGHRVAVGRDGHQTLPRDLHRLAEAVVGGDGGEWAERGLLGGQPLGGRAVGGVRWPHDIDPMEPGGALLRQVEIIVEGAPHQEVLLDELDQTLDGALLVAGGQRARNVSSTFGQEDGPNVVRVGPPPPPPPGQPCRSRPRRHGAAARLRPLTPRARSAEIPLWLAWSPQGTASAD